MALYTGLFAEMRGDSIDDYIGADETCTSPFEAVHSAKARAEIALAQMGVGFCSLLGLLQRGEELVAGDVWIVHQEPDLS